MLIYRWGKEAQRKEADCISSQIDRWQMQNLGADPWTLGSARVNLSAWVDYIHLSLGQVHECPEQVNWREDTLHIRVAPPPGGGFWQKRKKKIKEKANGAPEFVALRFMTGDTCDRCLILLPSPLWWTSPSLTTSQKKSFLLYSASHSSHKDRVTNPGLISTMLAS